VKLDHNRLSGTIPASLGSLNSLSYLHLDDNDLTGTIPASLGSSTSLRYLYLYNNGLTGTIPASLGSNNALSYLWLFNNGLTGTIPASLGSNNALSYLYLASDKQPYTNNLHGAVPESWCQQGSVVGHRYGCRIAGGNSLCLPRSCQSDWCGLNQRCPVCFAGRLDATGECIPHVRCAAGTFTQIPGNSRSQPMCESCPAGYYKASISATSTETDECDPHDTCTAGEWTEAAGTSTQDTKCTPCSDGFFRARAPTGKMAEQETDVCIAYTDCPRGQHPIIAGSSSGDHICGPMSQSPNKIPVSIAVPVSVASSAIVIGVSSFTW